MLNQTNCHFPAVGSPSFLRRDALTYTIMLLNHLHNIQT
ncbi:hypothetical protein BVRB_9g210450 [Beta vulgaris subsp. vulgaris]|nr:hypothetical protein BVRB_9g210450 [Beta vulgaris subsp. vulgaris]